jgi:choline dehydrogenase
MNDGMRSRSEDAEIVVVGAGTAGCVVAGRLAEAGRQVVVLEAGPDYGPFSEPGWPADLLDARTLPPSHDWGYVGPGFDDRELAFARAKVVGGCSAHNGCTQMVGWGPDYDRWAQDAPGWNAAELRPLFTAAYERMRMYKWKPDEIQPLHRAFVDAAAGLGVPVRDDFDDLDGGPSIGAAPVNIVDGIRWNSAFGYLDPVRRGRGLTVVADATVDRVSIDGSRAPRVEFHDADGSHSLSADHVVLCAGAYGSPEILLRSGIGPADALISLDVNVAVDLPGVGENLHDHPTAELHFEGTHALVTDLEAFAHEHWLPEEQTSAKIASSLCEGPYDLHIFPWIESDASLESGWRVVMPVALVTPRSRGRVTLRSGATGSPPIHHGYLQEPGDVHALADGVAWIAELIRSAPLARYLGKPLSVPDSEDRGSLRDWVRRNHQHYWHPAGSCRMGPEGDAFAVVGADGLVHGTSNMSVADASVFPRIPRATPAWPVVTAGERLARSLVDRLV